MVNDLDILKQLAVESFENQERYDLSSLVSHSYDSRTTGPRTYPCDRKDIIPAFFEGWE